MGLESATYIDEFVSTNPLAADNVSQGDNHLRLIKAVLQSSFPSVDMAVNAIHSSDSAPAVAITAGLVWFDTSANLLKIRNEANDAWVTLAVSPVTSNSVDINAGTVDGAIVGGSSAVAGTFTTLTANTSLTMAEDATIIFEGATADAYETTLTVVDPTADRTVSIPNATDTLVGKATTDTLTNKSIDLGTNTLTGSLAEFNSALQSESFASLTGSETLTNKTLTTPTLTTPVINTGASLKNGSSSAGYADFYEDSDNGTNYVRLIGPASTATVTVTLPAAADTLVGKATTDTLTNKSIDLGTNTLTGSLAEFNTALQSESFVSLTGSETLTSKTLTSPVLNTGVSGSAVLDEDDMSSDSATKVATQQSIKAYVTAQITAEDLDITTDSGTIDIDLNSETLTIAGGEGIDTSASGTTVTIAGEEASTSNKGVASFSSDNFSVSSGAVTIKDAGVANAELANMAANTIKVRDANSSGAPSDVALATTQLLIGDGTGFTAAALSSDVTMTNAGVVTIADNAVSLAKMAGLARGKIIYGDSSGDPAALAVGSADYVLTSDGTDISWVAATTGDITSVVAGTGMTGGATSGAATLNVIGGTGITANADDIEIDSTVTTLVGSQTLTNKTLTTPVINTGASLKNGSSSAGYADFYEDSDNGTNYVRVIGPASTATVTLTLPAATDTIVGKATTDTLTNKTLASSANTFDNATTSAKGMASFSSDNFSVSSGAVTIKDAGVANAELANMAANTIKVRDANSSGVPSDKALATTQILIGDGTGFTAAALSGDVTMTNAGAVTIAANSVDGTMIAMGSDAQGDVMYYDGTNWARLGYGTDGHFLKTQGASANPVWAAGAGGASDIDDLSDALVENNSIWLGNDPSGTTDTASYSVALGTTALDAITTGDNNTAIGYNTLSALTTGSGNTALGFEALDLATTCANNTAVGQYALGGVTTAANNVAVGHEALAAHATGTQNVAVGQGALKASVGTSNNTGLGALALTNTTGSYNTGVGNSALEANTSASNNTAVGYQALEAVQTAEGNVAVGAYALQASTAANNTALGRSALVANLAGASNVAVGRDALGANTTGSYSTAVGAYALDANTTANDNSAFGYNALTANTTGATNTALGHHAMSSTTTGTNNIGVGASALRANTTASNNSAVGRNALYATTTGGSNTGIGDRALAANTTGAENVALGMASLEVSTTGNGNTALGREAMKTNTTASSNTAVGNVALEYNSSGAKNVAIGQQALNANTTASDLVAIGYQAMIANTTGAYNTAVGSYALDANTTANNNSAFGHYTLSSCTTGYSNVATGNYALNTLVTGNNNVAMGDGAMRYLTGSNNVSMGMQSGHYFSSGDSNVTIGYQAGMGSSGNTTGNENVAVGYVTGKALTSGYSNTLVGRAAGYVITTGYRNVGLGGDSLRTNSPAGDVTTGNDIICFGDDNVAALYCAQTTISSSDKRDKTDIEDFSHGLDFINQMRPVSYRWDRRSWYAGANPTREEKLDAVPDGSKKREKLHIGFLGQEVQEIEKGLGYSNNRDDELVVNTNEDDTALGIKYELIVPVLVNAVKQLSTEVESLKAQLGV